MIVDSTKVVPLLNLKCFCYLVFCQGGRPSPFDRNLGTKMAAKCAEKLIQQIQQSVSSDGQSLKKLSHYSHLCLSVKVKLT